MAASRAHGARNSELGASFRAMGDVARELTGGHGVHAVYDGVGKDTFAAGLDALRPRGTMALYGYASGEPEPLVLDRLGGGRSLYVTRPTLPAYTATRDDLLARAEQVLEWVATGKLRVLIGGRYPLDEARRAHEDLESRATRGKLLLIPPAAAPA